MFLEIYSLRNFVFVECCLLILIFGSILLLHLYQTTTQAIQRRKEMAVKRLLFDRLVGSSGLKLSQSSLKTLVNVISEFESSFKGALWERVKEEMLLPHVRTMQRYAKAPFPEKKMLAYRAIFLCPKLHNKEEIQQLLLKAPPLLRGESIALLGLYPSLDALRSIIDQLASDQGYLKHTIRDALLRGNHTLFLQLLSLFRSDSQLYRRMACLEILSQRVGYLTLEDVKPWIEKNNLQMKWWAIKALENTPCDEAIALLVEQAKSDAVDIRAVVASTLGNFGFEEVSHILAELLSDSHWLVRLYAALSLRRFHHRGIEVMNMIAREKGGDAHSTVKYIMSLRSHINPQMMIKWLDSRAMR